MKKFIYLISIALLLVSLTPNNVKAEEESPPQAPRPKPKPKPGDAV